MKLMGLTMVRLVWLNFICWLLGPLPASAVTPETRAHLERSGARFK